MYLSALVQSLEFHCLDKERASAGLSSLDAVEVSAVDIIHDSPSIVDQWHVSILSNRSYELSVTLHDGIRFLPPPTPTVPSLPLAGSVPIAGRTLGFPCSIRKTFSFGLGAVFRPKGQCSFDVAKETADIHPSTVLVRAFSLSGQIRFRTLSSHSPYNDSLYVHHAEHTLAVASVESRMSPHCPKGFTPSDYSERMPRWGRWGTNPMVTSRFRFSHSSLSLSCRTRILDTP